MPYMCLSACIPHSPRLSPLSPPALPHRLCSGVLDAAKELEKLGKREAEATGKVSTLCTL